MRGNNTSKKRFILATLLLSGGVLPTLALAGQARCFMHGIISPLYDKEKSSLSDMLRLHFDANEKPKCEQMMSSYCQNHVKDKNYSPARLKGSFKPDSDKSEEFNYTFSNKCVLQSDE